MRAAISSSSSSSSSLSPQIPSFASFSYSPQAGAVVLRSNTTPKPLSSRHVVRPLLLLLLTPSSPLDKLTLAPHARSHYGGGASHLAAICPSLSTSLHPAAALSPPTGTSSTTALLLAAYLSLATARAPSLTRTSSTQTARSRTRSTAACAPALLPPLDSHLVPKLTLLCSRAQLPQDWRVPARRAVFAQAHQAAVLADARPPQRVPEPGAQPGHDVQPAPAPKGRAAARPEPAEQAQRGRDARVL